MKKKETRWYILWFFISGMWMIIFCGNFLNVNSSFDWTVVMQFLNIILSFAAGIVNRNRYKKRSAKDNSNQ